ncbi:hypothetical protein JXA84_09535 [candidate division WOR-3 bacterium]|nr:hypothetical protein [candidate division WOR-3 bacterium]
MPEERNFEAILSKIISLKEMISKAEQLKDKVRPDVYDKVINDYFIQLESYNSQLSGMGVEVNQKIQSLDKDIDELTKKIDYIQIQIEETEFRHMLGEIREEEYQQKNNTFALNRKQYEDSLVILSKSRKDFENLIGKFSTQNSYAETPVVKQETPKKGFPVDADDEIEAKFDSKEDFLSDSTFSFSDSPDKEPQQNKIEYASEKPDFEEPLVKDTFSVEAKKPESSDFEPIKTVQSVTDGYSKPKDSFEDSFDSLFQEDEEEDMTQEEPPSEEEDEDITSEMFETQDESENTIKCPKCGFENRPDAWNCEKCGSPIIL